MNEVKFKGIGWKGKIQKKKHTCFISVSKLVVVGNVLENKDEIYSYLADHNGRCVMITFLDGKPKNKEYPEPKPVEYNCFLDEKEK